jgi:hypothetical protein
VGVKRRSPPPIVAPDLAPHKIKPSTSGRRQGGVILDQERGGANRRVLGHNVPQIERSDPRVKDHTFRNENTSGLAVGAPTRGFSATR